MMHWQKHSPRIRTGEPVRIRGYARYAPALRVTSLERPLRGRGLVVPETLKSFFRQTPQPP